MVGHEIPPLALPEREASAEWYADGIARSVVNYADGTHNVLYRQLGDTINFRREEANTFMGDAPLVGRAVYRLNGEMTDSRTQRPVKRRYYIAPEYGVMLIDRDPANHTQPLVPARLSSIPRQVTLGEQLPLPDMAKLTPDPKRKPLTMPIRSVIMLADHISVDEVHPEPQVRQNRFLDRALPESGIPRQDGTSVPNPLVVMYSRLLEADAALTAHGL